MKSNTMNSTTPKTRTLNHSRSARRRSFLRGVNSRSLSRLNRGLRVEALEDRCLLFNPGGTDWGVGANVNYSFMADGIPDTNNLDGGWTSTALATMQGAGTMPVGFAAEIARAFQSWSRVANVNFTLVADGGEVFGDPAPAGAGDIRIGAHPIDGNVGSNTLAHAFGPGGGTGGDVHFDTANTFQTPGGGANLFNTTMHELGHSIGLGHSMIGTGEGPLMNPFVPTGVSPPNVFGAHLDDVQGAQIVYGARTIAALVVSAADDPAPFAQENNGTADTFTIRRRAETLVDPNANYADRAIDVLDVLINGNYAYSVNFAGLVSLTINGSADNDTLIVDFSGGNPVPSGGVLYAAAGGTADAMTLQGGSVNTVRHFLTNPTDGSVEFDGDTTDNGGAVETVINYTGLDPIADNLNAANRVFDFGAGNDGDVTVGDIAGAGLNRIQAPANAELVDFLNPTVSMTINLGSGLDVIELLTLDAAWAAPTININGGSDTDEIRIAATPAGTTTNVNTNLGVPDRIVLGAIVGSGGSNATNFSEFNTGVSTLDFILGTVNVADSGGIGQLFVDDSGDANADIIAFSNAAIVGAAPGTINYNAGTQIQDVQLACGTGSDTINVNSTGAPDTAANGNGTVIFGNPGNDVFNINGDNLSGINLFQGDGGNDTFNLDVAIDLGAGAIFPLTSLTIAGNAPAANSDNRDVLNIIDFDIASPVARNHVFDYLAASSGDLDVLPGAGGYAIPINVRTMETVRYAGGALQDDNITVRGTAGDDDLTVAPTGASSAVVFIGGDPWDGPIDGSFFDNLPGVAGGSNGPDLQLTGLSQSSITFEGDGASGIGDQLYVYAPSELPLVDPSTTDDLFGFGAGVLVPGFGVGNAFDQISASDTQVSITNIAVGALIDIVIDPTSGFVQDSPVDFGLIVNAGFEAAPGIDDPDCGDGIDSLADDIFVTPSFNFAILANGGDPNPSFIPEGDKANIFGFFESIDVYSDKAVPPAVTFVFNPFAGPTPFGVGFSSIECFGTLFAHTVNLIGDNNDPTVDQTDNFVVVGAETDFETNDGFSGDLDCANEFILNINGSFPIPFARVEFLNAFGFDQDPTGGLDDDPATGSTADDIDTLELTACADNADTGAHPPRGWGIDVFFNEGVPNQGDGAQQDLIIYHTSIGGGGGGSVSEDVVIQPSGPDNGEIRATNQVDGSVIVVIQYVANTDIIVLDDDLSLSDNDSLTLRGTNPNTPQTSGNDRFTANFIAAGDVANPMVVVEDPTNATPILYRLRTFSGFSTINLASLAGNDEFVLRNRAGLTVNIDGGDPVGSSSDRLGISVPTDAFYNLGADQTTAQIIAPGVGSTNLRNLESVGVSSETASSELVINALHGPDAFAVTLVGVAPPIPTVLLNSQHRVAFNGLNANFDELSLQGAGGDDTFEITTPLVGVAINTVGGSGIDRTNTFTPIGPDTATFTPINNQTATLAITGFGNIQLSNVETATYDGSTAANDSLTIAGTPVDDLTLVNPTSGGTGSFISNSSPAFSFRQFGALTVNGLAGTDSVEITGTEGVDTVTSDPDTVFFAGAGNVTMNAAVERMVLRTLAGNDSINLDLTSATLLKTVDGGDGNDTIDLAGSVDALIFGGLGDDIIVGSPAADLIFGGPGQDNISGLAGVDDIYGEAGNDTILGGLDADRMHGGDDFDIFTWNVGDGSDIIDGGDDGADILNFNGSAAAETFTLRPAPTNATHNNVILGGATVDTHGVEQINVLGAAGADNFILEDLTPTEVEEVNLDIGPVGEADNVRVLGRTVSDNVAISVVTATAPTRVNIAGLAYDVEIIGVAAGGLDTLSFEGREGNDTIVSSDDLNTLYSSAQVNLIAGLGDDFVSGFGTMFGDAGNDTLVGGAFGQTINGGDGNDQIFGGGGADTLNGNAGEDTFVPGFDTLIDSIDGGADFDTILVQGNSANNRIDARQDAIGQVSYEISGVNGGDGVLGGAGTETDVIVPQTVEQLTILAGSGDDLIRVAHNDSLIENGQQAFSLRFTVDGGAPGASDRLTVTDEEEGDTTIHRIGGIAGNGSYQVGALAPVVYTDIEFSSLDPLSPITGGTGTDGLGTLFVFKHDPFESNDSRPNATFLGSNSAINVDPTIDPGVDGLFGLPGDEDWYRIVAQFNGDLDIRVFHRIQGTLANTRAGLPGQGNLDIALYDADGQPIPIGGTGLFGANDADDDERVRIPAVEGQTYYLRVRGAPVAGPLTTANHAVTNDSPAINVYNVSVINTPAPVPFDLELDDVIATSAVVAAPAPTATTFAGGAALSAANDFYNGKDVVFTSGPLNGQRGRVVDYIGATRQFIFNANTFTGVSAVGNTFQIESVDTGRSQLDNITRDNTPTIFLRVADSRLLLDIPENGTSGEPGLPPDATVITIPFEPSTAPDSPNAGFRVAIIHVENNTHTIVGYAQPRTPPLVPGGPGVYEFTFTTPLIDGSHFIAARVEMTDPANPVQAQGLGALSQSLEIVVDTVIPPVFFGLPNVANDGLAPGSDSGIGFNQPTLSDRITNDTTPTFFGQAEADAVIRLYIDANNNTLFEPAIDFQIGFDVAEPFDGTNQYPQGYWEASSNFNLNALPLPLDGIRRIFVSAEDVAGNINNAPPNLVSLEIFIDTQGPQVTDVEINNVGDPYDLFDPKPSTDGPTPLVNSLVISFQDLPARVAQFLYVALKQEIAETPGIYQVRGDYNGIIPIRDIIVVNNAPVAGLPATATVELVFREPGADGVFNTSDDLGQPLFDDRYTLTIDDELQDIVGNHLDGESNASEPQEDPTFPSGDGVPGGDFVARFTVDSRPELGVWAAGSAFLDINGNTIWDPDNADFTNRDITHVMGYVSDDLFSGRFASDDGEGGLFDDGFDKLAAYGRVGTTTFRWLIDTDNDGVADIETLDPSNVNGLPVAGDFDLGSAGDEVGLFTGSRWHFDTDHNFQVDVNLPWTRFGVPVAGHPIVGDFDGDGFDDLGTWTDDTFSFDLSSINSVGGGLPGNAGIDGTIERQFRFGFAGPGERPVAADMNQDGIEDVGLWMPARDGITPRGQAEWYFLISGVTQNDTAGGPVGNIGPSITGGSYPVAADGPGAYLTPGTYGVASYTNGRIVVDPLFPGTNVVRFQAVPFGNDQYMQFGDEFALPLVGNFDPPVTGTPDDFNPAVNPRNEYDVNNDGKVNQIDLLGIVNWLTVNGFGAAPSGGFVTAPYVDVNADLFVNSTDLLVVLNYLTQHPPISSGGAGESGAEGEGGSADEYFTRLGSGGGSDGGDDDLLDLIARG